MCLHVVLKQPHLNIDAGTPISDQPLMRWCPYIGERLCKKTSFQVNGNPLDTYTTNAINFHRAVMVQPNKKLAWDRCVGQEETLEGWAQQPTWINNGVAPAAITGRVAAQVNIGNQTPTGQKDESEAGYVELFVPLLFWCN